jgi:uncharacterized SAM-binding protein YcdF (DUF218 family)
MIRSISITFVFIIIISFLIYFFNGLFNYQERILSIKEYSSKKASNIVILTGGSNRIKDGLKIIENFDNSAIKNIKLLISGTGKGFTTSNVNKLLPKNVYLNKFVKCCVKLDNKSENTYYNAIETFKWAKKNNIKTFILITSNYHMPRAFLEFKAKMPNFKIITHPITPKRHDINNWMDSFETFSLIFIEYSKFLIAHLRINALKIHVF